MARGGYELDYIPHISVQEFAELLGQVKEGIAVLDVREPGELEMGAMEGSIRVPLGRLQDRIGELDRDKLIVVRCKGGCRSSIATRLLRRAGFPRHRELTDGFGAWKTAQDHSTSTG
jgi:rhodanese-related sulfurtransferase